jgi:flavin-dependent thymidylate synthase
MKIVLAGFNTDAENGGGSPETLSAAYARISRDPRPIGELRREASREIEKSRASNRRIVFQYGHGSVAEHAVFNFDILDLSRLAAEEIQNFRLASFTEKSQRYIRLDEDLAVPPDLPTGLREDFCGTASALFPLYTQLYDGLLAEGNDPEAAREDARYVLPLAVTCQMGMTVNARELEHIVRRLSIHPLAEVRELAAGLLEVASRVAPSLFLFLEPTAMDAFAHSMSPAGAADREVVLIDCDDDSRVGGLLIQRETGLTLREARDGWVALDPAARRTLFEEALDGLGIHDQVPRQWEFFRAEIEATVSASAYAQLKRHRMCTRLVSAYDPALGVTMPPSIVGSSFEGWFHEGIRLAEGVAGRLGKLYPYLLTNAHRRRVTLSMDGRELYHFSRLREDEHAQWDIRSIAGDVMEKVRKAAPLTMMLTGGKSQLEGRAGRM